MTVFPVPGGPCVKSDGERRQGGDGEKRETNLDETERLLKHGLDGVDLRVVEVGERRSGDPVVDESAFSSYSPPLSCFTHLFGICALNT